MITPPQTFTKPNLLKTLFLSKSRLQARYRLEAIDAQIADLEFEKQVLERHLQQPVPQIFPRSASR